jgi:hypothetical protein
MKTSLPSQRIAASALMLLALGSSPLFAGQPAATTQQSQSLTTEVASSRINARGDWDVDYPSQLAPQILHPQVMAGMQTVAAVDGGTLPVKSSQTTGRNAQSAIVPASVP